MPTRSSPRTRSGFWFAISRILPWARLRTAVVGNQITLMARFQALEYVTSQNLDRRAFECVNAIGVVPGAIGAWRREALVQVGGYAHDTLAEDADVTIAIERSRWKILYEPRAIAFTEAPETVRAFLKQRFRWMFGTLQVAFKHAGELLVFPPTGVGLVTLPNIIVFQFAFTLLAPVMDLLLVLSLLLGLREWLAGSGFDVPENLVMVGRYWLLFQLIDMLAAAAGLKLGGDRNSWRLLPLCCSSNSLTGSFSITWPSGRWWRQSRGGSSAGASCCALEMQRRLRRRTHERRARQAGLTGEADGGCPW